MIVSVIFYALYPLMKLIGRVSEVWRRTPCSYINGREVEYGAGAPSRRLPELQTNLLPHSAQDTSQVMCDGCELQMDPVIEENTTARSERMESLKDISLVKESLQSHLKSDDSCDDTSRQGCADVNDELMYRSHRCDGDTHPGGSDMLLGFDPDTESDAVFTSSRPVFDLRAWLADVQMPAESVGWHFPAGVGLSDDLQWSKTCHISNG